MPTLKSPFIFLLTACFIMLGCGKKSKSAPVIEASPRTQTIFLKGDPRSLYAGTKLNSQSFITLNNYKDFENYQLEMYASFVQKEALEESDKEARKTPEEGNEPPTDDQSQDNNQARPFYFYNSIENNSYNYTNGKFSFVFTADKGVLSLKKMIVDNEYHIDLKTLHYSLKESKTHFSILVEANDSEVGNIVMAFYFSKIDQVKNVEISNKKYLDLYPYNYLLGPGVLVNWTQAKTISIDICGGVSSKSVEEYMKSVQVWADQLKNRLKVKYQFLINYPPFSDLNNQCIYTIDNYLTEANPGFINMATTYSYTNSLEGKFADADIFVWAQENRKFDKSYGGNVFYKDDFIKTRLKFTLIHELGHFFGLHHQFEKNVQSIMSYQDGIYELQDYDKKAINLLYPKLQNDNINEFRLF